MALLGLRCSNLGYSYVVMTGTKAAPAMLAHNTVLAPKGYVTPPRLKWMCHEITDLCRKHNIRAIFMKGTEGLASRGATFVDRIEMEAMVYYSGHELGIRHIVKKVKSTIAKDLGQKGKAKYLQTMDTSCFPALADLDEKEHEAALTVWSGLPA